MNSRAILATVAVKGDSSGAVIQEHLQLHLRKQPIPSVGNASDLGPFHVADCYYLARREGDGPNPTGAFSV